MYTTSGIPDTGSYNAHRILEYSRSFVKRRLAQNEVLYYFNISAALVLLVAGVAILLLTDSGSTITIYSTFPALKSECPDCKGESKTHFVPVPKELFSVCVGHLTAAYLVISSLDHVAVCTVGRDAYEHGIKRSYNIFRWIQYAFSASLMKVILALLCGIIDLNSLISIFGHSATTMILGLVFELENGDLSRAEHTVRWRIYWLAFIPHFFVWIIIFNAVYSTLDHTDTFVVAIIITIFLLDLAFPIILRLQWQARGMFHIYGSGEMAFTILSLVSKNVLAWVSFIGTN